jgi:hypothetical protein
MIKTDRFNFVIQNYLIYQNVSFLSPHPPLHHFLSLSTVTFRGPIQGSQPNPQFAKAGTETEIGCELVRMLQQPGYDERHHTSCELYSLSSDLYSIAGPPE